MHMLVCSLKQRYTERCFRTSDGTQTEWSNHPYEVSETTVSARLVAGVRAHVSLGRVGILDQSPAAPGSTLVCRAGNENIPADASIITAAYVTTPTTTHLNTPSGSD